MKYTFFLILVSFNLWAQKDLQFKDDKISLAHLQSTYSHLGSDEFALKLSGSLASPLLFFRSFVNTYYSEMSSQKNSSIKGTCFGDAHPENFGFILFKDRTRFVFNDFDDSGECWVEFDLLRYFVALSLAFNDPQLLNHTLKHFLEVLEDFSKAVEIDSRLVPSLAKKNKKILEKYTRSDNFRDLAELISIPAIDKKQLVNQLKMSSLFDKIRILDMVKVKRESGGSGGLDRFWILIKNSDNQLDILELKELAIPALAFLQPQPNQSSELRLTSLKNSLWGETPQFYHSLKLQETSYLVRSRTKDDVNLEKLKDTELRNYLKAQVSILALHHGKSKMIDTEKLGLWLARFVPVIHKRYETTYKFLLKTKK